MLHIPLSGERGKGMRAIVDDEMAHLASMRWYVSGGGYAICQRDRKNVYMHRLVNQTPPGFHTDHINGQRLDNRKENLRTLTCSQNIVNAGPRPNNKCGFKGVHWRPERKRWRAVIRISRKNVYLGSFRNIQDAVKAREAAENLYLTGGLTAMKEGGYAA